MSNLTKINSFNKIPCKPFLRWAGGKNWLVKKIYEFLPKDGFNTYHEPFLGGGSIYFYLQPERAYLTDLNKELTETYKSVQTEVEDIINELKGYKNTKDFYYKLRSKEFSKSYQRAAKFIYLNQTSFNGIYRVNLNGQYNVPYGFRTKDFFEPNNLRMVSKALKNCIINEGDFENIIDNVDEKDLVFLDPPYTVTHYNNGFIKYNQKLFKLEDQERLARLIKKIKDKGAYYILTNAAHPVVEEIFYTDITDRIETLQRASLIGGLKAKRGKYAELIITNTN